MAYRRYIGKGSEVRQDALGLTYMHVVERYDYSRGPLENYVASTVTKIALGKDKREVLGKDDDISSGWLLGSKSDSRLYMETSGIRKNQRDIRIDYNEEEKSEDIEACRKDFAKSYVKFFNTYLGLNHRDKPTDAQYLIETYNLDLLSDTKDYIDGIYRDQVEDFMLLAKAQTMKKATLEKMGNRYDRTIEKIGVIGREMMFEKKPGTHDKYVYYIDLERNRRLFEWMFYKDAEQMGRMDIEGIPCYITAAGEIVVDNLEEALATVEQELVWNILSTKLVKAVEYLEGEAFLVCTTKLIKEPLLFEVFGKQWEVKLVPVPVRYTEQQTSE
jgi:hypothetical protein